MPPVHRDRPQTEGAVRVHRDRGDVVFDLEPGHIDDEQTLHEHPSHQAVASGIAG